MMPTLEVLTNWIGPLDPAFGFRLASAALDATIVAGFLAALVTLVERRLIARSDTELAFTDFYLRGLRWFKRLRGRTVRHVLVSRVDNELR
jgi:hypothetical protein